MTKKVGRNDPCPCGSGKKYKKCCEQRLGPKHTFSASKLSGGGSLKGKASKISTNFFQKPPEEQKKEEVEEPRKPEDDEPHHPPEADKPI